MESETFIDPIDFLREIDAIDVRYLLVGRQALVLLGAPLMTADYDFYLSPEPDDLKALLALSRKLRLEPQPPNPGASPFFSLLCANLKLDFFRARTYTTIDGERFGFDELFERRKTIPLGDFAVYVPTIEDLIRIKRTRDLPRDREDIKYLQVLLERDGEST